MLIHLSNFIFIYSCFLALLVGAVLGSFLNCAAFRIARGEPFARGRSHCPSCGHMLGVCDLVPVLSWTFLGGKCRYCKTPISPRYPVTEFIMAAVSLLTLLQCDISILYVRNMFFASALFCLSLVDLEIYEIPDGTHLISIAAWIGALFFLEDPIGLLKNGLAGGLFLGGGVLLLSLIFDKILGKESMGGGDIKLLFTAGLYLGLVTGLFMLILACLIGILFSVIRPGKKEEGFRIPFGPAISIAAYVMLLYGQPFTQWYLGLMR